MAWSRRVAMGIGCWRAEISGAAKAAERLREAAAKPFTALSDVPLSITISAGVATFRADTADGKALLAEADRALYAGQDGGS